MKLPLCLIVILFFIGYPQITIGQSIEDVPKDLNFKHFTSTDGLSQRSVLSILQDKKGYIWFGTRDGLNKFDGNQFIVYKHIQDDTTSLSNNNVHSIYEDLRGNLWVGTQNGLNRYNPKQDNFTQYKHSDAPNTITDDVIWQITQLDDHLLWVATDNGISQINISTDEILRIQNQKDNPNSLSDNETRSFLKTDDGNLWICNTRYIDIYNPEKGSFKRMDYPKQQNKDIHLNGRPALFKDSQNSIWLGYEGGLAKYDHSLNIFEDFEFRDEKAITNAVRSICEDLSGNLWIGTYSGLYLLNSEYTHLKHIVHDKNRSNSLSQNSIYKIIRDSRGDMWIGTWADGINYYNRDNGAFKNISFGNSNNMLNYKVVSGIAEDLDGNLWIGTEGGGLNFYNRETKEFIYHKNDPDDNHSLQANNVKDVIIDRNGNIWIGMHDGGVSFLNPDKRPFRFEQIDFPGSSDINLKGYKVLTLIEDKNGDIWIGTLTGGIIFYNTQTKQLSKFSSDIRTVMSIVQTENPDVLVAGGYNNRLETINIKTKKTTEIPIENTLKKGSPLYINCIFIDNFNNYWLGTEGDGLYRYDPKVKKTKTYGIKEGLPNDIIYGILSDANGNLWISTNNGISRLNIESNKIKNYYQSDGLQGKEFNYGSFFKTRDRELFFGGTNGLTYFDPGNIRKNSFVPNIDISTLEVNNAPYVKISDHISEIILKHNENNFSVDFTSLSYMQPEKNEFAYILEGKDQEWNYVRSRKAVYTNIEEGAYTFKVKGSNNDGVWNEKGDFLHIRILPAPWRTWWAYLLYLASCIGLALYIGKLILLRIKEKKEKERSEEINQLKLRLFTDVSHDFRTPLTLIIGPLEKMIHNNSGDPYVRQQHEIMYRNARMLLQLINQILDFRKSESGVLFLRASKAKIVPFIEDIKKSFDALAERKNIKYPLTVSSENIEVWFDRIKLKKILFNLLSNAFKYTDDNSEIIINISTISKKQNSKPVVYVKIDIINFGPVIPKNEIKFIFDRFYQLEHEKKNLGSGIGLSLTKRLTELHQGKIIAKSSETKGTRFSVLLKLGKDHLSKSECIDEMELMDDDEFYVDINTLKTDRQFEKSEKGSSIPTHKQDLPGLIIVEDNLDVQNFIREIFINRYNIFVAENGKQAITIASENPIDLIISDINMPVMDGFELCDHIKTTLITSHIPVILLTAKTSPTHQERGYKTGADAYITKPFNADILETRVDNLLKTRASLIRKFKKDIILEPKKLNITSADEIFLEKAISIVEEHITNQDFNTSLFIDQMNMSRTVIYTKLKALTGQNLSTFIRIIRLKKSGLLISQTTMNISQIAYEVGFNDLKYFRKCFKDFFKLTPSEYKRKNSMETKND